MFCDFSFKSAFYRGTVLLFVICLNMCDFRSKSCFKKQYKCVNKYLKKTCFYSVVMIVYFIINFNIQSGLFIYFSIKVYFWAMKCIRNLLFQVQL